MSFVACHDVAPGQSEVITKPVGMDTATGAAEIRAEADGWATLSFEWKPGDRQGLLVLWARRPVRGDLTSGRPVGNPQKTGYTVIKHIPGSHG